MGAEMDCAWCHCSPCACPPNEGRNAPVGRITFGPEKKGIVADPVTGQGDARRLPGEVVCRLPGDYGDGYDEPFGRDVGEEIVTDKPKLSTKDTNPKDAVGTRKWRQFTTVPFTIIWELGVAMLEGARKYGRHNYRVAGVRGSVYIDAAFGHLSQWWEGEDHDPDTGLNHITKAMASLAVLRDAMIQGKFVDDRPPKTDIGAVRDELQARVDEIFERIPEAKAAYVEGDQYEKV